MLLDSGPGCGPQRVGTSIARTGPNVGDGPSVAASRFVSPSRTSMLSTALAGSTASPNAPCGEPLPQAAGTSSSPPQSSPPQSWGVDRWNSPIASTALAVSALVLSEQHGGGLDELGDPSQIDSAYQGDLSELLMGSMHWLAKRQHPDGGWGTSEEQPARLAVTLLVRATFQLTGMPAAYPELAERMNSYLQSQGGIDMMNLRSGRWSETSLLVRGCYSLSEVVDWKQLPAIPIESAGFWSSRSASLPAIGALGLASFQLRPPRNPFTRWRRGRATQRTLDWLADRQSDDGGFSGSIPVTSFVLMCLASAGKTSSPIVRQGVEFLFSSVDGEGSWPSHSSKAEASGESDSLVETDANHRQVACY